MSRPDPRFFDALGPISLGALAELTGAAVEVSFADKAIEAAAVLSRADAASVAFFSDRRLADAAGATAAGACFVTEQNKPLLPDGCAVIVTPIPDAAWALAAGRLHRGKRLDPADPPRHPGALIEDDVSIGHGAVIGAGVQIGAGTEIGPHAVIGPGVAIGRAQPDRRRCGHRLRTDRRWGDDRPWRRDRRARLRPRRRAQRADGRSPARPRDHPGQCRHRPADLCRPWRVRRHRDRREHQDRQPGSNRPQRRDRTKLRHRWPLRTLGQRGAGRRGAHGRSRGARRPRRRSALVRSWRQPPA